MKKNILRQLYMLSKRLFYGFLIQLFFCTVLLANTGNAQRKTIEEVKISINLEEKTLAQFFRQVEAKTDFKFTYNDDLVDLRQKVTVAVSNRSLYEILESVSLQTQLNFVQVNENIHVKLPDDAGKEQTTDVFQAVDVTVSGTVTDANGDPIPGVTVSVSGTTIGTSTDIDGNYTLSVPEGSTLVFSFIGFEAQSIAVGDKGVIDVILSEDMASLDEVVVVGYGTQERRDVTGSIASVGSEEIQQVVATNAVQSIQGRVAGLDITQNSWNPGAEATVRLRGNRSFTASNDPLYVVDGIPISRGLSEINPSDIESIEVLKDASATAIYGSRGANGVIIITTKRGKEGKTTVNYDGYAGIQQPLRTLNIMDGGEYAEFVREAYRNRSSNAYEGSTPSVEEDQKNVIFTQHPYTLESVLMGYDEQGNYDPNRVRSFDWVDAAMRDGSIQNHQLSVAGGTEKTTFLVSGAYFSNTGIMKAMDYSRYSLRLNLDHQISDLIKIGTSTVTSYVLENSGTNLYGSARQQNPLATPYDDEGNYVLNPGNDALAVNPLLNIEGVVNEHRRVRALSNIYLEADLTDGLKFRANLGLDFRTARDGRFEASMSAPRNGNPALSEYRGNNAIGYTLENLLFYNKTFNEKHKVGVTLLQSIQTDRFEEHRNTVQNLPYEHQLFYNVGSASQILGVHSNLNEWQMLSWMGRINYSFMDKYLLTISGRRDGSSVLAEGRKYAFFPSAALAWRVSDEEFLAQSRFVNDLKLRIGYGKTGNAAVNPYQTQGSLQLMRYAWDETVIIGFGPSGFPNSRLGWETTSQYNIGLDYAFINGRINGAIDLYQSNTNDLLMNRQIPVVSGFGSVLENVGRTRNTGFEFAISTVNIESTDNGLLWSTDFIFSTNKEEIIELYGGTENDVGNKWFIGEPIGVHYDHQFGGIWQDTDQDREEMLEFNANGHNYEPGLIRLVDQNGDYRINNEDRVILGNNRPKWIGSFTNRLEYKRFDFSFQLYANYGSMLIFNKALRMEGRWNTVSVNYWTPENQSNDYPKPSANWETPPDIGTLYYQDGSFVRVKFVTLGYTLPSSLMSKFKMSNFRFYLSAQNPYLFTKFDGLDPEGATGFETPSPKTFMLGVNIGF